MIEERYKRYGDIWAGLLAKRTCDAAGLAVVVNGAASVEHTRASDPARNLELELPGEGPNAWLWHRLGYGERISEETPTGIYAAYLRRFARAFDLNGDPPYAEVVTRAAAEWLALDWPA